MCVFLCVCVCVKMDRADGDLAVEEASVLDAVLVDGPAHPELHATRDGVRRPKCEPLTKLPGKYKTVRKKSGLGFEVRVLTQF